MKTSVFSSVQETYGWLDEVADAMDDDDRVVALAALRSVLHALRSELTIEQNAEFAAKLPTLLRGVYYEEWDPSIPPVAPGMDDFLKRVETELQECRGPCSADDASNAVLAVLQTHITSLADADGSQSLAV